MHDLVKLAKDTISSYIKEDKIIAPPSKLTAEMKEKAGVFVSIHLKDGSLRGCIGTFAPTQDNVAKEIIANAISASTQDPRFPAIEQNELDDLVINVDVLSPPERVNDILSLDAKKYGVIVKSGYKRGLLLPDLEGVDTVEDQINICKRKGGIGESEPVELFRFIVRRYK